ncbi:hypothetical protein HOY80DRAFT_1006569 [Tuber brumale]|nr:hypothetical protein HOY80DRAFT_1006569 [Tuber brumale]
MAGRESQPIPRVLVEPVQEGNDEGQENVDWRWCVACQRVKDIACFDRDQAGQSRLSCRDCLAGDRNYRASESSQQGQLNQAGGVKNEQESYDAETGKVLNRLVQVMRNHRGGVVGVDTGRRVTTLTGLSVEHGEGAAGIV